VRHGLDTHINRVTKSIPFGRLGYASLGYRGDKTQSRLLPRNQPVCFLSYDLQSTNGIFVLIRKNDSYSRVNIMARDVRWCPNQKFAFEQSLTNMRILRRFATDILRTSAILPVQDDEESQQRGGEELHTDVISEVISDCDDDVSSTTSTPVSPVKTRNQRRAEEQRKMPIELSSSSSPDDEVQTDQAKKMINKRKTMRSKISKSRRRFLTARKVKIVNSYQATMLTIINSMGVFLFAKGFRQLVDKNQLDDKQKDDVYSGFLSNATKHVTAEDLRLVEEEELKDCDRSKYQAFALIVNTRKALRDGEPGKTELEKTVCKQKWKEGIESEVQSLISEGVLRLRPIKAATSSDELLPSLLILTVKGDGRYKARIVAAGNHAKYQPKEDIYSSVVGKDSWQPLLIHAATSHLSVAQIDVKTAFLQTTPQHDDADRPKTFIRLPWGCTGTTETPNPAFCWEICKSIYGLKSAPRAWQQTLTSFLKSDGFVVSKYDDSIYTKVTKDKNGIGDRVVLLLYIDDLIYLGQRQTVQKEINALKKRFKTTDEIYLSKDQCLMFLGHEISLSDTELCISQEKYVLDVAQKFNLLETADRCKNINPAMFSSEWLNDDSTLSSKQQTLLRSYVGAVSYCAYSTRPDCMALTAILAEGQSNGTVRHVATIEKLICYMVKTKERKLTYNLAVDREPKWPIELFLDGYFDSNYQAPKSRSGLILYANDHPVFFKSKKQAVVALSTTEAELIACTLCSRELMSLRNLYSEVFGIGNVTMRLLGDNMACCLIAQRSASVRRVRHLSIDLLYCRQFVEQGVEVVWVSTKRNPSDILTKPLTTSVMQSLYNIIFDKTQRGPES
jgi:hypothetical protein